MNVNELPQYKCHKVVRAGVICSWHSCGLVSVEIKGTDTIIEVEVGQKWIEKHNPESGGYLVVYEDGYTSYSPAAAFEAGYHLVEVGSSSGGVGELCDAIGGLAVFVAHDGSIVNAGTVKAFEHALFEGVTIVTINDNAEKFLLPRICSDIKVGDYLLKTQDGQLRHMARAAFLSTYKPVVQEIDLEAADFSDALMWLKEGKRVCRSGWNGAGQFAWMVPPGSYPARMEAIKGHYPDDMVPYGAYFALKNAQGTVVPWVPSVGDLLATDWQVFSESAVATPSYLFEKDDGTESLVFVENAQPHQVRVIDEYKDLQTRHQALTAFFDSDVYRGLDVEERNRLKEQCLLMGEYLRVLLSRMQAF